MLSALLEDLLKYYVNRRGLRLGFLNYFLYSLLMMNLTGWSSRLISYTWHKAKKGVPRCFSGYTTNVGGDTFSGSLLVRMATIDSVESYSSTRLSPVRN